MWAPRKETDSRNKISHSHYKILSKLIETCWRWLSMTGSYYIKTNVARTIHRPHVKSRTIEIKSHVHIIKFYRNWLKFVEDDSVWLTAILCKIVWLELHVGLHQELDPRNKISRSHYKILSKSTKIYWRWLSMTSNYSLQSSVVRLTWAPCWAVPQNLIYS